MEKLHSCDCCFIKISVHLACLEAQLIGHSIFLYGLQILVHVVHVSVLLGASLYFLSKQSLLWTGDGPHLHHSNWINTVAWVDCLERPEHVISQGRLSVVTVVPGSIVLEQNCYMCRKKLWSFKKLRTCRKWRFHCILRYHWTIIYTHCYINKYIRESVCRL